MSTPSGSAKCSQLLENPARISQTNAKVFLKRYSKDIPGRDIPGIGPGVAQDSDIPKSRLELESCARPPPAGPGSGFQMECPGPGDPQPGRRRSNIMIATDSDGDTVTVTVTVTGGTVGHDS